MATKLSAIIKEAEAHGLKVYTYNPGDGINRIRFFLAGPNATDYFADSGLFTALGKKQALIWLQGFIAGKSLAEEEHTNF